ncbi:hypothetical protein Tco_1274936, partial [Tanacetum coccineum]
MDLNQSDDERNHFFEVDDETDIWFMMQAYKYNQRLEEEQNQPRLTRNPIKRDREDAETRLMADYFDDNWAIRVAGANNDINVLDNSLLFDDLLDDIAHVAPFVEFFLGVGVEMLKLMGRCYGVMTLEPLRQH